MRLTGAGRTRGQVGKRNREGERQQGQTAGGGREAAAPEAMRGEDQGRRQGESGEGGEEPSHRAGGRESAAGELEKFVVVADIVAGVVGVGSEDEEDGGG